MSTSSQSTTGRALIAGAGPVGLTAAAHLIRHGHGIDCRIVDKSPSPAETSRALVLWPRSQEMLDDLGVVEVFLNAGKTVNAATLNGGGHVLARIPLNEPDTHFPRPLMLAQSETERLLTEHLQRVGLKVERSVELTGFTDRVDQVVALLRHEDGRVEEFGCDWLIGSDGAHSAVRKGLDLGFTGEAEPNDWVLADCHIDGPIPMDEISLFWHAKGVLGLFPITADYGRVIADMGTAKTTGKPPDPSLEAMQEIVDERGPGGLRLSEPRWLSGFRIHERKVSAYGRGRVFLAGDAAHIHSPAGGQGMNTGMQDAFNLAWKLGLVQAGRGRAEPLLESYTVERGAVGESVLRNATRLTAIATLRNPVGQFLRNRLVGLASMFPAFRRNFARNFSELSIHYPVSPLNGERDGSSGVQPGDRVPDGPLRESGTNREERLHSVTRGPGHNLLLFPASPDPTSIAAFENLGIQTRSSYAGLIRVHLILPGEAADSIPLDAFDHAWLDPGRAIATRLGVREPTTALVRPDGYLGYRARSTSWDALRRHLERYLIAIA